jgi:site-specific DNA-methyltransferase (adenine-specific)
MNPYYQDDLVTLYHGDCLSVMCEWLSAEAEPDYGQIIVTSPPYNMGLVPGGNGRGMYRPGASNKAGRFRNGYSVANDDALAQHEYNQLRRDELGVMWDLLPNDGAIFYNHRPRVEHGVLRDPLNNDFGIPLRQRIVWNRLTGIDVNLRAFCTRGEYVLFFAKPDLKLASHAVSGMGDVWNLGMDHEADWHPAPFPVSLPSRCIEATAARSVLDPFAGSGSSLVAARLAGIPSVGIEESEAFCERIAKRLDQGVLDFGESA